MEGINEGDIKGNESTSERVELIKNAEMSVTGMLKEALMGLEVAGKIIERGVDRVGDR